MTTKQNDTVALTDEQTDTVALTDEQNDAEALTDEKLDAVAGGAISIQSNIASMVPRETTIPTHPRGIKGS